VWKWLSKYGIAVLVPLKTLSVRLAWFTGIFGVASVIENIMLLAVRRHEEAVMTSAIHSIFRSLHKEWLLRLLPRCWVKQIGISVGCEASQSIVWSPATTCRVDDVDKLSIGTLQRLWALVHIDNIWRCLAIGIHILALPLQLWH
jgi:hypothetical protein